MDLDAFFDAVEQHDDLEGVGVDYDKQEVIVRHKSSKHCTTAHVSAIEQCEWPEIEEILTLQREPRVLYHMTRVVGYFSRIENWSISKLGELKDRVRGDYSCGTLGRSDVAATLATIDSVALAEEGVRDEVLASAG